MRTKEQQHNWYIKNKDYHKRYQKDNAIKIKRYRKTIAWKMPGYVKKWKINNPEAYKVAEEKTKRNRKQFFWSLKNNPCVDCGLRFHPVAMDFDHLPGYKKLSVNGLYCMAKQKLLDEIKKCELVCANCHRIRTWNRRIK